MAKNEYRNKPYQVEFNIPPAVQFVDCKSSIKTTILLDNQDGASAMDYYLERLFGTGIIISAFGGPNDVEIQ